MNPIQLEQVRQKTSFEPLLHGGTSFCDRRLSFEGRRRVRLSPTLGPLLFFIPFLAVGGVTAALGVAQKEFFLVFFGAFFLLIPTAMLCIFIGRRMCFDLITGRFIIGKRIVEFSQIAALQVIRKVCHRNKGGKYECWELNLVLDDASRINLLNHANNKRFTEDANRLAEALDLKVWSRNDDCSPEAEEAKKKLLQRQQGSFGFLIVFGLFFAGVPLVMLSTQYIVPLARHCLSADWVECPAKVMASTVESRRGSRSRVYRLDVKASYEWEGRRYVCERFDFFRSHTFTNIGVEGMRRIADEFPPGTETFCLVNPNHPEQSVMRRQMPPWQSLIVVLFMVPFLAIGGFCIYSGVKGVMEKRRHEGMPHAKAD